MDLTVRTVFATVRVRTDVLPSDPYCEDNFARPTKAEWVTSSFDDFHLSQPARYLPGYRGAGIPASTSKIAHPDSFSRWASLRK